MIHDLLKKKLDNIAKELINSFKNKIVLFNGDMGSGKTTIISSIVNFLDLKLIHLYFLTTYCY